MWIILDILDGGSGHDCNLEFSFNAAFDFFFRTKYFLILTQVHVWL